MKLFYRKLIFFNLLSLLAFQNAFSAEADAGDSKQQAELKAEKDVHEQAVDESFENDPAQILKIFIKAISDEPDDDRLKIPFQKAPYLYNTDQGFGNGSEDHFIQAFEKALELGLNVSEVRKYYLTPCLLDVALEKKFLKFVQFLSNNNIIDEHCYLCRLLEKYLCGDKDVLDCFEALFKKYDNKDDKKIDLLIKIIDKYPIGKRTRRLQSRFIDLLKRLQVKNYLVEIDKLIGDRTEILQRANWNVIKATLLK